jgi:hypothetical protein
MDPEELLNRHPTIQEAVAWFELHADIPELLKAVQGGMNLQGLVRAFTEVVDESLAEDNPPNAVQLLRARGQFDTPDFRQYLAGRLGLV